LRRQIEPRSRKVLRFQFNRAQQPSPVVAPLFFSPNVAPPILAVLAQAPRVSSRACLPQAGKAIADSDVVGSDVLFAFAFLGGGSFSLPAAKRAHLALPSIGYFRRPKLYYGLV